MLDTVLDAAFTFNEETVPVVEGPEPEKGELRLVGSKIYADCDVVTVALPTDAMRGPKN